MIATGFERTNMPRRVIETPMNEARDRQERVPAVVKPESQTVKDFQPRAYNTEDLDIPTFLRNRK